MRILGASILGEELPTLERAERVGNFKTATIEGGNIKPGCGLVKEFARVTLRRSSVWSRERTPYTECGVEGVVFFVLGHGYVNIFFG